CARLLKENAVFAGVDPEFRVADERESWPMQLAAMRAAIDALLQEDRPAMRGLIHGLSAFDFEAAVRSAYDAMRGAGVRVEQLEQFPTPDGIAVDQIAGTLAAIRRESLSAWGYAQKQVLHAALEGAER